MAANGGGGGGGGEDGGDLLQAVEAFFSDTEDAVVMAFRVAKSQASWSVAGRRTRHSTKPRVLALTGVKCGRFLTIDRSFSFLLRFTLILLEILIRIVGFAMLVNADMAFSTLQ